MAEKKPRRSRRRQASARPAAAPIAAPNPLALRAGVLGAQGTVDLTRQRILTTVDPLGQAGGVAALVQARAAAVSNLYLGMQQVHDGLRQLDVVLATRTLPTQLVGVLLEPDGSPAAQLQVQFSPASLGGTGTPVTALTDASGNFQLTVPAGIALPDNASVSLVIHGSNGNASVSIPAAQVAANGLIGTIPLSQTLYSLPLSIVAALEALAPPPPVASAANTDTSTAQLPVVKVGEDDNALLQYTANTSVDRFPYSIFFRLVEPRASIVSQASTVPQGNRFTFLPNYLTQMMATVATPNPEQPAPAVPGAAISHSLATAANRRTGTFPGPGQPPAGPDGTVTYVDRVPVEQPISVDGFRERVMGLQPDGTFTGDETVPMAGTLGLGYLLWMSQRWTFKGVALGDLVYSLPLAPGEQQQMAIFERTDTAQVSESEFFSESQVLQESALADTSTQATFNSAFNESINGRSTFDTHSDSSSWGVACIIASGGGGSSSASGVSTQSLQGQRDTTQQAAQNTHSAAESQASARRSAMRTGMRIATTSESQSVTTKSVTNHNHTRALTMQYWEVQRLYDVTTAIDGLQLCCLVPLQVVRFMPPGQPLTLSDTVPVGTRAQLLARYDGIIRHADVLMQALPRRFQYGLTLLRQFVSDPTASVDAGGVAEDVVNLTLTGSFVSCEDVYVAVVTDRNTRVGPVRLTNPSSRPPPDTFADQDQLIGSLRAQRQDGSVSLTGAISLPPTMNRNNVVGFEISRGFRPLSYTLISPQMAAINGLNTTFGGTSWLNQAIQSTLGQDPRASARDTVTLQPTQLENELGGPRAFGFSAAILELQGNTLTSPPNEQYANDSLGGIELPAQPYPVPALRLGPVLRFTQILEIEQMAQHVVRNTVLYSRALWLSLSPEERAIMLEAYTIGVPPGGLQDATQMVPLLNCVENRVLGFFGNSMILPFNIPQGLAMQPGADGQAPDPARIQDSLLAYQQATFKPPHTTIALPTRGVLGEAVLGHSPSAEKIDLTRFWNWKDSPGDTAPTISPVTLPTTTPSPAAGLTGPNSLTQLPSLINNVLTAPAPDTSLLQAMGKDASSQQDFSSALTGAAQLASLVTNAQNTANAARADALKTTKDLHAQAIATVGNIIGGIYGGNPNAGSNAAAAVSGQGAGTTPSGQTASKGTATGSKGGPTGGGPTGGGPTGGGPTGGGPTGGGPTGGGPTGGGPTGGGPTGGGPTGGGPTGGGPTGGGGPNNP